MGHLTTGMDASIGTPGDREPDRRQPRHPHQRVLDVALNSALPRLTRPPRERSAVIGKIEA